jgi:hypothetical protein
MLTKERAMKNPIPSSNIWVTHNSVDQLFEALNQYTGQEKTLALHVAMMTLNTCHNLVEQQHVEEKV